MEVGGQCHTLADLPPGKTRLGGPQSGSGRVENLAPPPGFNPWIVQSAASRYIE
jgi:hypothetical protein